MFCPKCGALLIPKKENNKKVLACSCGYSTKNTELATIKESMGKKKDVEVVEEDFEANPVMKAKCEKCGNDEAYFWLVQTRASDEPQTKFLKCTKCRHVWRDYD